MVTLFDTTPLLVHFHHTLELAGQRVTHYLMECLLFFFDFGLCAGVVLGQVGVFEDVLSESRATN